MSKTFRFRNPLLLLALLLIAGFAAKEAYAACHPAPLSDAKVISNYRWAQQVARMGPKELERLYRKAPNEVSSPAELKRRMARFVSKPLSFHREEMRKYRVACARGGDGGGQWTRPDPQCTNPNQCTTGEQCISGRCERIGSTPGDCHRGQCPSGFNCMSDGICR